MDLKITNRGKDYFIEQLQKKRKADLEQLVSFRHNAGELETKLWQLEATHNRAESRSERADEIPKDG